MATLRRNGNAANLELGHEMSTEQFRKKAQRRQPKVTAPWPVDISCQRDCSASGYECQQQGAARSRVDTKMSRQLLSPRPVDIECQQKRPTRGRVDTKCQRRFLQPVLLTLNVNGTNLPVNIQCQRNRLARGRVDTKCQRDAPPADI